MDYRFQKSRSYSVREYVTQYLESDFDFINRLCEEDGIWYASVFKHHGFSGVDYRFQKSRSYSVREYVTQYLDLIQNLAIGLSTLLLGLSSVQAADANVGTTLRP